jgi:general secretion pathway protein C
MLDSVPRPVRILAVLALFAFGFAMIANFGIGQLLKVDAQKLAAIRAGAPAPVVAVTDGEGEPAEPAAAEPEPATPSARTRTLAWYQRPIVKRNLFNSEASAKPPEPENPNPTEDLVPSDIEAVLISTSEAYPPQYSTAILQIKDEATEVYGVGEEFLDAKILAVKAPWIDRNGNHRNARIEILRNGQQEYLEVGGEKKSKATKKAEKDEKPKAKKKSGRHTWDGIKKSGDNEWTVEKGELDYALANLDKLSREARVVPHFADGQTNGFKVFSIRRNSALRKMGMKNNDVITGVNGHSLANTEKALELYTKLSSETDFEVTILRNGSEQTMRYRVQ